MATSQLHVLLQSQLPELRVSGSMVFNKQICIRPEVFLAPA